MPHVYRRGKTWWCQVRQDRRLIRFSLRTRDAATAKRLVQDLQYEMVKALVFRDLGLDPGQNGALGSPRSNALPAGSVIALPESAVSLVEAWERYQAWAKVHHSSRTLEREQLVWKHFTAYAKGKSNYDGEEYVRYRLGKRATPGGVNVEVRHLKAICGRLVKMSALPSNPFDGQSLIRTPKAERRVLTEQQVQNILTAAQDYSRDMHLLFAVGLYAGLRLGELIAMRWEWFDFTNRVIRVTDSDAFRTKSRASRTIPMHKDLERVLLLYRKPDGFVIAPERSATGRYRCDVRGSFAAVCTKAGVTGFHPHAMRHEFISRCAASGVPSSKIKAWAGHSTLAVTEGYMHVNGGFDADIDKVK